MVVAALFGTRSMEGFASLCATHRKLHCFLRDFSICGSGDTLHPGHASALRDLHCDAGKTPGQARGMRILRGDYFSTLWMWRVMTYCCTIESMLLHTQ